MIKSKTITKKDIKNLLVAMALICLATVLSATQAQAADVATSGQKSSGGRFIALDRSDTSNKAVNHANGTFKSLASVRRDGRANKPIPLHGERPQIMTLRDPSIAHRVAMAKPSAEKEATKTDVATIELAAVSPTILPEALEPIQDFLPHVEMKKTSSLMNVPPHESMSYVWPVEGARHQKISSNFGPRKHPVTGEDDFHAGIDIPAPKGTSVLAALDGEVTGIGTHPRLGRYIKVTHADGTYALYGHLQSWQTKTGRQVKAGERIGKVGSTGRSTGPHLDFSIRRDGKPFDPLPLLVEALGEKTLAMFN